LSTPQANAAEQRHAVHVAEAAARQAQLESQVESQVAEARAQVGAHTTHENTVQIQIG